MQEESMTLVEHLSELRRRLIWVIVVLVIAMIGGFFAAIHLLEYFKSVPPASEIEWNAFSLWDGIQVYMQFAFIIALIVVLPFTLYQIWAFVRPGLREVERRATLRYIPFTVVMFLLGLAFAYFIVFKMAFMFTSSVNRSIGLTETYGIIQYFSFMFNILLPISLLFELPIVVMFLTKLRILTPPRLRKMRRYAYMILVIVGTVITPPDLISDILVIIPLILLYEFSVFLSGMIYRKQLERDRQWEEEFGD
ncbi:MULTISPECIES: twin-arginine translocase subunit TatC [Paenibacillus]|uniref:Sec-independent protein translocase protein TatC n=1 Tax=Paenibacillus residui TaxID=629724 RepID=A0ABW3D7W2_9BACL|nr:MULTISPECIES: twin-arginine translocase subunit TatC [Paenibacillaceae]